MTEAPEQTQFKDDIEPPVIDDHNDDSGDGDDDDRGGNWVTAATFWTPAEAQLARLKLESEEIDCVLFDENFVAADWLMANAVGGIKLKVREGDLRLARESLARPRADMQRAVSDEPLSDGQVTCPRCASEYIRRTWFGRRKLTLLSILFLGAPIPFFFGPRWRCDDCGFEWRGAAGDANPNGERT